MGDALGEWKHEGRFDKAGIAGKKLYIFHDYENKKRHDCILHPGKKCEYKHASKGARLTHADLWAVAKGAVIRWENIAPTYSVSHAPKFLARNIKFTASKGKAGK